MNRLSPAVRFLRPIRSVLSAVILLLGLVIPGLAEPPKSLLPAFGPAGREFKPKAKEGYDIHGWLPKDWVDNSSWAPVSATYSELKDAPAGGVGAVRIEVQKVDGYHVQLTTKEGARKYKQGTTYVVSGWVRSPQYTDVFVGFREDGEPRDFYAGTDLVVDKEWKPFSFEWTPEQDSTAWLMFHIHKVGIVDLAGVALNEKP